jgi:hypothetical protein
VPVLPVLQREAFAVPESTEGASVILLAAGAAVDEAGTEVRSRGQVSTLPRARFDPDLRIGCVHPFRLTEVAAPLEACGM